MAASGATAAAKKPFGVDSESHFRRAKEIRIEEPHEAHNVLAEALPRRSRSVGGDDLNILGNVVTRISA